MKSEFLWKLTAEENPSLYSNVEISDDGINVTETADYTDERHCMLAGVGGGNGYFGYDGFASDGSQCDRGLILDDPKYWRYHAGS